MRINIKPFYLRNRFWFLDWKDGSPIRRQYKEIKFLTEHTYEEGLPLREKALRELLMYAQQYTQFYAAYKSLNLSDYPVMNKLSFIDNYDTIAVNPQQIPGQQGPVFIQKTSGSTGTPLAMPQDTLKRKRRIAEIKYFGQKVGYCSHEKLIHLRTWNKWQTKTGRQIKNENIIPFDIKRLGTPELEILCHLIEKERPVSLRGYASTLGRIADVAEYLSIKSPKELKVIVSTSESLEDDIRAKVKRVFRCECISQYASEECGIMAQERIPTREANNEMYFNWASYIFEFLKLDKDEPAEYGEVARIVLTDLHNHAFPIIRYDTGDTCIISPPNEYSRGYPVMSKLYGRKFDLTYTTDGTPIYPLAYGRIIKNFSSISQWQFIQKTESKYQLRLVVSHKDDADIKEIKNEIQTILGTNASIEVVLTEDIPVLSSGKRKPVINEWKQNMNVKNFTPPTIKNPDI
jgi:phenylacetate-CoA ligase